tara:strand:+ start:167 stop:289 length:123 start_codon:yes stop_codon:yes gene_type:complete
VEVVVLEMLPQEDPADLVVAAEWITELVQILQVDPETVLQ